MKYPSTIRLLIEWARWGQGHNISYPSMSPMFGERALKSPLYGIGHIPADVLQVEQAVCRIEFKHRYVIILRYQRHMSFAKLGRRLDISRWAASDRLKAAEYEVHHELQKILVGHAPTRHDPTQDSITTPTTSHARKSRVAFCV